ncbi:sensor histidine kinase [Dyadobacter sp. CY356]|uniref:sensor histidine kinase n=1 Tax=Dyadobacter sp. CY356 TaxID=2906442 RepID=UPI001F41E1C1|nr:ATP-binding protein [Dyadobacter sp. CY356]MCF0055617.1 ATP-binding protein [Dyadobacter sp. CY356]
MEFFLLTFFLIQFIRKRLETATKLPEWEKLLIGARYVSIGLVAAFYIFDESKLVTWLWYPFVGYIMWIIFTKDVFKPVRSLAQGAFPFIAIALFTDFAELIVPHKLYSQYSDYLVTAKVFAFIWLFAVWYNSQKQQRILDKEREEQRIKDEVNQAKKEALEYLVTERTIELTRQKEELQKTLDELKSTQVQLIQSEKMASLGELTAGIAHEIQNPLNFVNNFSEVSVELCQELEEEIQKTSLPEADKEYIAGIISDLSQNQQKITHHGKRADSIVKGMLQHSRTSSGHKEPTDINALADEYMRLAYHGLRAKDKEFNAALVTDFDPTIGKVDVLPQDLGRVFLNLFTNAFYAVAEKKRLNRDNPVITDYKPEVKVITKMFANKLYIRVIDNGTGMPESVKAKIFQPFFTTKPTGQGTGLGLSMSYDIITKSHDGLLDVTSIPGESTEFKITIPISTKEI